MTTARTFSKSLVLVGLALIVAGAAVLVSPAMSAFNERVMEEGGGGGDIGGGGGGGGTTTQCNDNIDNDGNGLKDYPADQGCTSASDTTEAGYVPPPQCSDNIDNDGNGLKDYPADQGCSSAADTSESGYVTQCKDNIDNDGNGLKDYPADQGCSGFGDTSESGYTPPPAPAPGVVVFKSTSKRDFHTRMYQDQRANGNIEETAAFGYPGTPNVQAPTGNRICSLYDPTAYITWWSTGGFSSPGNNSMAAWYPAEGKWKKSSAGSFGNRRYNYIECTTKAPPDTSLTAAANGVTSSQQISVVEGTPVTLTWKSTYGQVRKGTMSAINFDLTTTVAGHWQTVTNLTCDDSYWNEDDNTRFESTYVSAPKRSLMGLPAGCFFASETVWIPESTTSRPFGGSKVVTPSETTTYTYRGSNANGTNSSSVTVNVTPADGITANLTANPMNITPGSGPQSSTLTWGSTGADSCVGTGFSTGGAVSGSVAVSPAVTTSYTVTCYSEGSAGDGDGGGDGGGGGGGAGGTGGSCLADGALVEDGSGFAPINQQLMQESQCCSGMAVTGGPYGNDTFCYQSMPGGLGGDDEDPPVGGEQASASVTVTVGALLNECDDDVDNDNDGLTDTDDDECAGPNDPNEGTGTISCTVDNSQVQLGGQTTYRAVNATGDAGAPYTWTQSAQVDCSGGANNTCTFPGLGDYTMTLRADNSNSVSCPVVSTECAGEVEINLMTLNNVDRVNPGESISIEWDISGVSDPACTLTSSDGGFAPINIPILACEADSSISGGVTAQIDTQTTFTLTCGGQSESMLINVSSGLIEF